ncbi:MAG: hypothetical protein ABIK65_07215 [Candidatus Eisenbacteria bacterium]
MKRIGIALIVLAAAALLAAPGVRADDGHWLHVYVQEKGDGGDKVRVNLPFSLIEAVLPLIEEEEFSGGKVRIDHQELDSEDIHAILKAVREAEEGEYVHVDGIEENVRVSKQGDYLTVNVEEEKEEGEPNTVRVRIPLVVLDAMISGGEDEIDVLGAIRALAEHGGGDFVLVNDDEDQVRIWIDQKASGE